MNRDRTAFLVAVMAIAAIVAVGCGGPFDPSGGPSGGSTTPSPTSVGALIRSIPEVTMRLPRSLGGDGVSPTASMSLSRMLSVTTLDPQNVSGIRTSLWNSLRQSNPFMGLTNHFLSRLKQIDEQQGLRVGQIYSMDVSVDDMAFLGDDQVAYMNEMDHFGGQARFAIVEYRTGFMRLEGGLHLEIRDTYEGTTMSQVLSSPFTLVYETDGGANQVVLTADAAMASEYGAQTYDDRFELVATIDLTTGGFDMIGRNVGDYPWIHYSRVSTHGDSISLVNAGGRPTDTGLDQMSVYVGHGNDSIGGVGGLYDSRGQEWDWETETWNEFPARYVHREFFNSNGNLIYSQWGRDYSQDTTWFEQETTNDWYLNLRDSFAGAPDDLVVERRSTDGTLTSIVIIAGDVSTEITGPEMSTYPYWPSYYFRASDAVVTTGDAMYWAETSDWSTEGSESVYRIYYRKGWSVAAPRTLFGGDFYLDTTYPLVNLLPLTVPGWTVKQEEGATHEWEWTDWEGNPQTSFHTDYSFWIEVGGDGNSADTLDRELGDIPLDHLYQQEYWTYNSQTNQWESAPFYVYRTSEPLPAYFRQPGSTGAVAAALDQLVVDAQQIDLQSYLDTLDQYIGDREAFSQYLGE